MVLSWVKGDNGRKGINGRNVSYDTLRDDSVDSEETKLFNSACCNATQIRIHKHAQMRSGYNLPWVSLKLLQSKHTIYTTNNYYTLAV